MKPRSSITLALLTLALSGCASQGALDPLRNDIYAIKTRLFSVEKEQEGIRDEMGGRQATLEKELRGEMATVRKIAADTQANGDSIRNELQAVNGRLDDMAGNVKKPNEELTRYREDADKRIIALEERIVKLQASVDDLTRKLGGAPAPPEAPPTPDGVYMKALETFKGGDMPSAREQFTRFIEQYPKHELVGNARYWIGETLYGEKNYEAAIVAFQDVIKLHPQQPKVAAAMLKQARAFKAIDDTKSARYVLKKLVEGYPKSDEAKKARELLKELK